MAKSRNNSMDNARVLFEAIVNNPTHPLEIRERAARHVVKIAAIRTMQRRDARVLRLQKQLADAHKRIQELEGQLPKEEVYTSIRDMVAGRPVGQP